MPIRTSAPSWLRLSTQVSLGGWPACGRWFASRGRNPSGLYSMRPLLHPTLLNGRTGDPAIYIETLFEQRAILFDLGDITSLSPRKIRRLEYVFVSHAHIDHFFGFDRLLRLLVGRDKQISLYGPAGFVDRVHHKLQAYLWNLGS